MRRWLVERFFAWLQWQRRIVVRWEYHAQNLAAAAADRNRCSASFSVICRLLLILPLLD
jgi:transposase